MTKLIIQIPCYNEQDTLGITLAELPRSLPGVDTVEWLIVNDGSTDRTVEVAREHGVDHVIDLPHNQGLAKAFMAGLEGCLKAGADIIVNTDADNQYRAADIEKLVAPILEGRAEIVIGARPIGDIAHFSPIKKYLQKLGSWVVRVTSGTDIRDAPCGFRAISRRAALQLNVFNDFTYTFETIIQAGRRNIPIVSVAIGTNPDLRPSRLSKSTWTYVTQSVFIILRIFLVYKPLRFFLILGTIPFSIGFLLGVRWLVLHYLFPDPTRTYIPSLILAAILLLIGFQTYVVALIADLMATNRTLLEEVRLRLRQADVDDPGAPPDPGNRPKG